MEYLGHLTLASVISKGKVRDDHECYKLMLSLARQLKELHACEIVHVDLKPNNVVVTYEDHEPKAHLIDFGNATKMGRKSPYGARNHWMHEVKMKPWCAPELFQGEPLDGKTDVVGLAYCLQRMQPLLKHSNPMLPLMIEKAMVHLRDERPTLDTLIEHITRWTK